MSKKLTLGWFQGAARDRRGQCLAERYEGIHQVMEWECDRAHRWRASAASIRYARSWCPRCARRTVTHEDMRALAAARGGEVLSDCYQNIRQKMAFRCARGHVFTARVNDVRNGHWCSGCAGGVGERLCRQAFEALFGTPFPKTRPAWLVGPSGRRLELDGYSEELRLAFEHQGRQHDHVLPFFGQTRLERLARSRRDRVKRRRCEEEGVTLVEVPEVPGQLHPDRLLEFLVNALRARGIRVPIEDVTLELAQAYSPLQGVALAELRELAQERGGELVTVGYLGSQVKHRLRCGRGHEFLAKPAQLRQGAWCGPCRRTVRHTEEDLAAMGATLGGHLVGGSYRNRHTPMRWRCADGHEFDRSVAHLALGRWCGTCARASSDEEREGRALEELRRLAAAKGGACVSERYLGNASKLRWRCELGHEWEAVPNNVKRGSWCRCCSYIDRGLRLRDPSCTALPR